MEFGLAMDQYKNIDTLSEERKKMRPWIGGCIIRKNEKIEEHSTELYLEHRITIVGHAFLL
jgi:hypothetical protein